MRGWIKRRRASDAERGALLPLTAIMMVTLVGLSAFAVDLGWFYVNSARVQRAAESAALAGVVHMPQDYLGKAAPTAMQIAAANGYDDGFDRASVTVTDGLHWGQPNQIEVEISDTVDTFFLRIFGRTEQTITRSAVAECVPPLPLGSPE
jgi:Flp pilus assembly protein TadG